jgi:hypothetical protein
MDFIDSRYSQPPKVAHYSRPQRWRTLATGYRFRYNKVRHSSSKKYPKSCKRLSCQPFRPDRAVFLLFAKILRGELRSSAICGIHHTAMAVSRAAQREPEEEEAPYPIAPSLNHPQRSPPL